jgi:hypothetical protein
MLDTIGFDIDANGWSSRFSFIPEMMVGLDSNFYSFKDGNIYKHHSDDVDRCEFYSIHHDSSITTELNDSFAEIKFFKTLSIDSTKPWMAELFTDLNTGVITEDSFEQLEGEWCAYIRKIDSTTITEEDSTLKSSQGIGVCTSYNSGVITFSSGIDTSTVSVGDRVYKVSGSFTYLGVVQSYTSNTITIQSIVATPAALDFIMIGKNKTAETDGMRGYHMNVKLTNSSANEVEIFSVASNLFKSYP